MSVKFILSQAGNKMGLDPSVEKQRSVLLRYLNEGAAELYDQADLTGSLEECLFKVNGDQTVSFPTYFGDLRAARPFDSQIPMHINQMRPRYNVVNWPDMWRNYRIKNKHPLSKTVTNQSVVTVSVHAVETPPIEVTITGPTDYSACVTETLVMDAVTKTTSETFNDIMSLTKDRVNDYNAILTDVDGQELGMIPNNQLFSLFLIVDVSTFPFSNNNGGSQEAHWVETLYKKRLTVLSKDSDEFPCAGYDNVLVNKMMQLWKEEQDKPDAALAYDAKASRTAARIMENENRATEDVVGLVPCPMNNLLQRVTPNRPGWYPVIRHI